MIAAWLRRRGVLILALALVAACGASARQKSLRGSFVAVEAAAAGFVDWDAEHQDLIVNQLADDYADGERRLAAYRARRAPVVDAFAIAYRILAAAALDQDQPLPVGVLTNLSEVIDKFQRGEATEP